MMADKVTRRGLLGRGFALVVGLGGVKALPAQESLNLTPEERQEQEALMRSLGQAMSLRIDSEYVDLVRREAGCTK